MFTSLVEVKIFRKYKPLFNSKLKSLMTDFGIAQKFESNVSVFQTDAHLETFNHQIFH